VQSYVADLRRNYPPETAEQLLQATLKKSGSGLKATGLSQHHEAAEAERELKVYRAREVPDDPIPLAQPVPTAELHHPAPPAHPPPAPPASPRMPKPIAWTRPPAAIPLRPVPPASKVDEALDDDEEGPTGFGYWTSSVLFVVTLLLGLALLAYSLARPFWQ
jgi:hypothetical protein